MKKKIKHSTGDNAFFMMNDAFLLVAFVLVLFPTIYIVSSSFSSPTAVSTGRVFLLPVDFSLEGYAAVFKHPSIVSGFQNTIFYTVTGTLVNLVMTILAAYPLSRAKMPGKNIIMFL